MKAALKIRSLKKIFALASWFILWQGCAVFVSEKPKYDYDKMDGVTERLHKKVESFLESCIIEGGPVKLSRHTRIDSVVVDEEKEHLDVYLNRFFSFIPFRERSTQQIYEAMEDELGWWDSEYTITFYTTNNTIEELIPNLYRSDTSRYDKNRLTGKKLKEPPVVRNANKPWQANMCLYGKHIALWHSHGWYYEESLDRWQWQRARIFQSVEDLGPMALTIPYIIPMLENAGANVFLPRERDIQTNEIIIDNDSYQGANPHYQEISFCDSIFWRRVASPGFAIGYPPYGSWVNPFRQGSFRIIETNKESTAQISWTPEIPESGKYAVYISYTSSDSNITDAKYIVHHSGGKTEYLVNQQMGGGTWIYLGEFIFTAGINPDIGKVVLTNQSGESGKYVTADAVRFGGGMGNVIRGNQVSGRPRYMEGARYYLQYAGMPDTLVYTVSGNTNDYIDDYKGRGEWVNYLKGAPFGPNKDRSIKGLGIPIDISLAFHTDAGTTLNDIVVGTLSIYSTFDAESTLVFPDNVSRFASRDFADILQTQIVEDMRATFDPVWNRRGLWDRGYHEAYRPNVPAVLLELLSHFNFLDMKFFLDPRFRFYASRSIYKAILKFLTTQYGETYVVQPLPVKSFLALFKEPGRVLLQWQPQVDKLEETAKPDKYIVYTRREDSNFDNGILVDSNRIIMDISPGVVYSYKITAVNKGGESFPSEILSICRLENEQDPVLIINGFDRVSGPATIETDTFKGFVNFFDAGVPDKYDLDFTGTQFSFDPSYRWTDDDAPGFGSSYGDMETRIIPGNTFDFAYVHGQSLRDAGYSFMSVSDEAVMEDELDLADYKYVDLILGEEKKTSLPKNIDKVDFKTFPHSLKTRIINFCENGGNLFISGAHVGTDLFYEPPVDSMDIKFARNTLKYFWRSNHAAKTGSISVTDSLFRVSLENFRFNTTYHPNIYMVEAPDAIEPADSTARTILRYAENNMSAAVAHQGDYNVVVFGFPFEAIIGQDARNKVMQAVLRFFTEN